MEAEPETLALEAEHEKEQGEEEHAQNADVQKRAKQQPSRTSEAFSPPTERPRPATVGSWNSPRWADGAWVPPPGAFNEPDLPVFPNPGPGRYNPTVVLTKPRVVGAAFPMENRWKHLGRQRDSTRVLDGSASSAILSTWGPQIGLSPGPVYLPSYSATELQGRSSSFPIQSHKQSSAVAAVSGAKRPGPGTYSPVEQYAVLSTKPRVGRMAAFSTEDRLKYLGVQLVGGRAIQPASPGPAYAPKVDLIMPSPGGVAFGQPRSLKQKKAMVLRDNTPGPASYTLPSQAAVLSTKPNVGAPTFGREKRASNVQPGKPGGMQSRRPTTPGPQYLPSYDYVRPQSRSAMIGTAKRFSRAMVLA